MKNWAADHPKAKLMERKREAIVAAARSAFLADGFGGASMEKIAKSAGVSIMTLYRHASGKDDLFAAVIAGICHDEARADDPRVQEVLQHSLGEILVFVGSMFQQRILSPATTTLLKAVMTEVSRFPHLAEIAYDGLIGAHVIELDRFLAVRNEASAVPAERRRASCIAFFDQLLGVDMLRVLLGLPGLSEADQQIRAKVATAELLRALEAGLDR